MLGTDYKNKDSRRSKNKIIAVISDTFLATVIDHVFVHMKFVLRLKIYFSLRTICFEQCVFYLLVYCLLTV